MMEKLKRYQTVIIVALFGSIIAWTALVFIQSYEHQRLQSQFSNTFSDKITGLSRAILAIEKILIATQRLVQIQQQVTRDDFRLLINQNLLINTGMLGVQWVPIIDRSQLTEFETRIQQSGAFDYRIAPIVSTQHCHNQFTDKLLPVAFSEPQDEIGDELGRNLNADCGLLAGLRKSVSHGDITASAFTNDNNESGIKLLLPVKRDAQLIGFVVGIVMMEQLIERLWGNITVANHDVLRIYRDKHNSLLLYQSNWRQGYRSEARNLNQTRNLNRQLLLTKTLPFANQLWNIHYSRDISPRETEFFQQRYYAYAAAIFVLVLTTVLCLYLRAGIDRIHWANQLVIKQTRSLQHQAEHDPLTHLKNKKSLLDFLSLQGRLKAAEFRPFCILFIDLDHFKRINDTMGHVVGDKLLKMAAERLRHHSRAVDLLYRFGGDEFVVVLEGLTDVQDISEIAHQYLAALTAIYPIDNQDLTIGASIGASIIHDAVVNTDDILRNADIAMYQAKEKGRGRVVFFNEAMYHKLICEHRLESELKFAVESDQLTLDFQPIYCNQLRLAGFEALVRWEHPDKGRMDPAAFIPVAEKSNAILDIGKFVIEKAVAQLAKWLQHLSPEHCPYISINISPLQLKESETVNHIISTLEKYQVPGALMAIELTESALINNRSQVKTYLSELKRYGVKIYLDDFGTGYSSLSMLKDFPIDVIKIDQSFITALRHPQQDAKELIKAIVSMAEALRLNVVAEGIEHPEVSDWLINLGCQQLQGFYFSPPIPHIHVTHWLHAQNMDNNRTAN